MTRAKRRTYAASISKAAPELLDACEDALWFLLPHEQEEQAEGREGRARRLADKLRKAIAKAGPSLCRTERADDGRICLMVDDHSGPHHFIRAFDEAGEP